MNLIEFQDYPSTETPLNAENLNHNFNELNKANTYSTEEQVIGTWADGKPIYRKIASFDKIGNINFDVPIDNLTNAHCQVKSKLDSGWRNIPWLYNYNDAAGDVRWTGSFYVSSTGLVMFQVGSTLGDISKGNITIEYTKTTD
jgi:hypothetical protein